MLILSQSQFDLLLLDKTKEIYGDIHWEKDLEHQGSLIFQVGIDSSIENNLFIKGTFNQKRETLTYSMILPPYGSIYRLDMGQTHRNPDRRQKIGRVHKHRWTEQYRDKWAYAPDDITEPVTNPEGVWRQFCLESNTKHAGNMIGLSTGLQGELF
ncbi:MULTISPECIES: DUF6978 family protein [unclassified Picosynechococcus]|uniref:DUF6978 family protein n=1 Tax=unclassified Picosynechococcus TaxID=3079910 RepID=UPI000810998E|nr:MULTISPECIES: hypothetical protein [unclassified Picosynechococcus]ANV86322.1 hypothetical protein AWQ22_01880 [Picosynechococcus sp. PCC 7117]